MLYAHVLHVFQVFFPTGVTGADDPTKFWPREFQGGWIGWIWLNHQPETNLDSQGREILIDLIDCCCVLSTWKLSHSCGVLYLLMPPMACLIACPAGRSSVSYKQPIGLLFKTTFLVVDSLTNSKSTFWPLRPRFLMLKKFQAPNIHCQKWRCRFEPAPWSSLPHPSLATHSTPPRHHGWTVAALATAWKLAPTRQATQRWAVVEDEHCQAVGAWLRNFVIAKDFCPWAKPAKKLGSAEAAEGSKIWCWCWMKLMLSLGEWRNKHVCNVSGHFCMYIYIYT